MISGALSETGTLTDVVLKHARDAFSSDGAIAAQWQALNFTAPPDLGRAIAEYDDFAALITSTGARVRFLPASEGAGMDSIYVRDASIVTPRGVVLCRMGKRQREPEPDAQRRAFSEFDVPIAGAITAPGTLEGGDVVWLDARVIAVGRGYRTNAAGIAQLRALLGDSVEVVEVPLPHWRGPGDVFHLMSIISPVDTDLAVAYSRLMPVPFLELLQERGIRLIDVPDDEFDAMGANVLALGPRRCLMVEGSPRTRALLERAGAEVLVYAGAEISVKGGGGPTCLTRPLRRASGLDTSI
jgi:N-dimethylarginine dimethylaminohydrolase